MKSTRYEYVEKELKKHGFTPYEMIGEGCFGVVHKVVDKDGNVLAVKTVKLQRGRYGASDVRRFRDSGTQRRLCEINRDEITVANALAAHLKKAPGDYDGIVKVYGTIVTAQYYHVVMECLVGSDLKTFVEQRYPGGMPLLLVQRLVWSVLRGLRVMHSLGALHRDMKPDNVFVEHDAAGNVGGFKLIDVGLGRLAIEKEVDEDDENNCNNGNNVDGGVYGACKDEGSDNLPLMLARSCVGAPLYRSPAVEAGMPYGAECDIWGAGYILYYGSTGRCLTSKDRGTLPKEKRDVWENCGMYNFEFPGVFSDDVKFILRSTMSKTPQSVTELLSDFWFESLRVQSSFI